MIYDAADSVIMKDVSIYKQLKINHPLFLQVHHKLSRCNSSITFSRSHTLKKPILHSLEGDVVEEFFGYNSFKLKRICMKPKT